jgi:hypothetical protein
MGDGAHHHHGSHRTPDDAPRWHHRLREHGRRTMARVQSSCLPLMVAMFLLLGLTWLFEEPGKPVKPFVIFLYAAVPMLGVLLVTTRRWAIAAFLLLVASNAAAFIAPSLAGEEGIMHWPGKLLVIYYGVVILALVRVIFVLRTPVRDRVFGGVAVMMMFGVFCAIFYRQMLAIDPHALVMTDANHPHDDPMNWNDTVYFSFVTLATIGFGDIVPGNSMARSLAMIEGLIGVLYPAVLLARLVSRDGNDHDARHG